MDSCYLCDGPADYKNDGEPALCVRCRPWPEPSVVPLEAKDEGDAGFLDQAIEETHLKVQNLGWCHNCFSYVEHHLVHCGRCGMRQPLLSLHGVDLKKYLNEPLFKPRPDGAPEAAIDRATEHWYVSRRGRTPVLRLFKRSVK